MLTNLVDPQKEGKENILVEPVGTEGGSYILPNSDPIILSSSWMTVVVSFQKLKIWY